MLNGKACALAAGALAWAAPALSGPCTSKIDAAQAEVDAQLEAVAGAGGYGAESAGSKLHRQPTPGSIAEAEAKLKEGPGVDEAANALARARAEDAAGNRPGCERELAKVADWLAKKKA
jgi:hypothetical protein